MKTFNQYIFENNKIEEYTYSDKINGVDIKINFVVFNTGFNPNDSECAIDFQRKDDTLINCDNNIVSHNLKVKSIVIDGTTLKYGRYKPHIVISFDYKLALTKKGKSLLLSYPIKYDDTIGETDDIEIKENLHFNYEEIETKFNVKIDYDLLDLNEYSLRKIYPSSRYDSVAPFRKDIAEILKKIESKYKKSAREALPKTISKCYCWQE